MPNETTYTFEHLETAAVMWEHVLAQFRSRRASNPWTEYNAAYGLDALRVKVIQHAPILFAAYEAGTENGYTKAFDWQFVPQYMEDHVTRILT